MPLIGGGKKAKKTSSSTTKRHFTVVMGNKEHGLYVSSSPSSAARKAVSKLCATDKKRKVQFQIRETTQKSIKKTYGPYLGYIEKLAKPIELKGRVIKYKPVAKLIGKKTKTGGAKKRGSILVVEAKDGKVIKKYITKKEADKHMKQRHKRLDKDGIKKKKKKSMRGGGEHEVAEQINNTSGNYKIKVSRSVKDGPIQILLLKTGLNESIEPNQITYDESKQHDFKTVSTNNNYLITIDGGEYPEPEKKLSDFLIKYTESIGVRVSDYARNQGLNGNKIIKDIKLLEEHDPNFWEILNEINQGF
jgi:hypothetical protein